MNRHRKLLCWIGSIMLSLSQAEIVPEPIARFTAGEDTLAEETLLSRGQYPILGSEIGARLIFHRQSTLWTLLNFDSPSSGCVSPSNMRTARSNLSVGGRMIVNPSLLIGAYIQGETLRPFVEEDAGTLTNALLSPLHTNAAYSIGVGVDSMFLHPTAKGLYPLQIALGGHYTLSDPNKPLYQTLLAYDKAGATLKVAVEHSKWSKYFVTGHYHYHGGKVSTKPDIQHNTGTALGAEHRLNRYVSLVLQGEWNAYAGYYGRAMLHLNVLGSQAPTNRSLQSYLKAESPRQIAPIMFVEELHNTPGSAPAAEEMTSSLPHSLTNKHSASSSAGGTVNTRAPSYYGASRVKPLSEVGSYTSTKKPLPHSEGKLNFLRLLSGSSVKDRRINGSALWSPQANENTRDWLNNSPTLAIGKNDRLTNSDVTLVNSSSGETSVQTQIHTFLDCLPELQLDLEEAIQAEDGTEYPKDLIEQLIKPMDAIVEALPDSRSKKTTKAEKQPDKRIFSILNILTAKAKVDGMPRLSTTDRKAISEFAKCYEELNAQYSSESSDADNRGRNTQSKYTTTSKPDKVRSQSTRHRSQSKPPADKQSNRDSSRRAASRAPTANSKRSTSKVRVRDDNSDDERQTTSNKARSSSRRPKERPRSSSRAPVSNSKHSTSKVRVRDDNSDDERQTTSNKARSSSRRPKERPRSSSRAPSTGGWGGFFGTKSTDSSTLSSSAQHNRTDSGVESSQKSKRQRASSRAPQEQSKGGRSNVADSGNDKKKAKPTVSFPAELTDNQEEADPTTPRDVTPYGQREEGDGKLFRFMEGAAQEHGLDSNKLAAIRVRDTKQALSKAQRDAKKPWEGMQSKISKLPYLKNLPDEEWNSVKSDVKALRGKVEETAKFKKWKEQLIQTNERKRGQPYALTYEDCIRFLRKHSDLLDDKDKNCLHERVVPALTLHIVEEDKQSIKPELADIHQQAFSHKKPSTTAAVYYDIIQNAAESILTDAENKELLDLTFSILMRIPDDRKFLQDQNYVVKKDEIARAAAVKQIKEIKP